MSGAERLWRTYCALAATHLYGRTWPPPGEAQRDRVVGHWGCNPGIAWAVAHLAAVADDEPMTLVIGTGHATGFTFAHDAIVAGATAAEISDAAARYGQVGGDPSERLGERDVPYVGGELGPALGVGQAIAAAGDRLVVTVVGDGECESPVALAALAHGPVLLDGTGARWLAVINANGARMGGPARFDERSFRSLIEGLGYRVVISGTDGETASEAARAALAGAERGEPTVWISVTDKGWPAPPELGAGEYRGHHAHKAPPNRDAATFESQLGGWLSSLAAGDPFGPNLEPEVVAVARRFTLRTATSPLAAAPPRAAFDPPDRPWSPPVAAVDHVLTARRTRVFSPDEATSNGLRCCVDAGLVTEVLAEELCSAWTWGTIEAGREAVLATYEAFAPLVATQVAQYTKLISSRPPAGRPPFAMLLTSLGWANAPTHQNADLVATLLARAGGPVRLYAPIGARSAARRMEQLLDEPDVVGAVVCSKQPLLDLSDPGHPAVELREADGPPVDAVLVALGDVCVTESVGAMALARTLGVGVAVIAVIEPTAVAACGTVVSAGVPALGVAWCPPAIAAPAVWPLIGRLSPIVGYRERWGPTAWETLRANELDRCSLLGAVGELTGALERHAVAQVAAALDSEAAGGAGVPHFGCPDLVAVGLGNAAAARW